MYNKDFKQAYINSHPSSLKNKPQHASFFERIAPYEEKVGCDISQMRPEDLQTVIDAVLCGGSARKSSEYYYLRSYCNWCIEHGLTSVDALSGVVIDGIGSEKIRSYTVANPMAFREYVDSLFPPTDEPTSRYKLRCALWLSYIGVRKTDILNVKESDIDLLSLSVQYNGDLLEIYRESIEPFRKMLSSDCYLLTGHHGYTTHTKKTEGDALIRDVSRRSSGTTIESLTSDISRAATVANRNGITSKRLSLNDAWLSGMFYRQYERERAGVTSILREITALSMEVEKWRNNPSTFNRKYKSIVCQYEDWKSVNT